MAAKKEVTFVIRARDLTRGVLRRIRRGIGDIRIGLGSLVAGFGLTRLVRGMLDFSTSIEATSQRLDISAESLQRWQQLAADANVPMETFATVLQRIQSNAGAALRGDTNIAERFQALGFSLRDLEQLSPDEMLLRIADAAQRMGGNRQFRDMLRDIGDTEAIRLIPLLQQGAASLIRARDEVVVASNEEIKQAAEAEAAIRREMARVQLEVNRELLKILPLLLEAVRELNEFIQATREKGFVDTAATAAQNAPGLFGSVARASGELGAAAFNAQQILIETLPRIERNTRDGPGLGE